MITQEAIHTALTAYVAVIANRKGRHIMARNSMHQASYEVFEVCTIDVCGKHHQGAKAVCGWCQTSNSISVNTFGQGSRSGGDEIREQFARRKFEGMGWKVGKTAKENRCPGCFSKIKLAAKSKHEAKIMAKDSKVIPIKQEAMETVSAAAVAAAQVQHVDPPVELRRASTREDRRIILAKLQEVYVDEKTGYSAGWNDKRIATDLGVEQGWVASLRDEHFGPNVDEQHTRVLASTKALLDEIVEEAERIERARKALFDKAAQIEAQFNELKRQR